jgi:hypothetical protein
MTTFGATIRVEVDAAYRCELLHTLESHADVFVVGERRQAATGRVVYLLRSDSFPAAWEGRDARPLVTWTGRLLSWNVGHSLVGVATK